MLVLDTPGGLVSTTREVVGDILASRVPIIVYVAPAGARAGSAGVFITLAGHVAAMAPATNIGAAHPVGLGQPLPGEEGKGDGEPSERQVLARKIENDLVAFARAIAEERDRNVGWAVAAVRESKSVSASEALKEGVIDLVARDRQTLLDAVDGRRVRLVDGSTRTLRTRDAEIVTLEWSPKQRFLHVIGEPNIAAILIALGALGLVMELFQPGAILPGVSGAIMLLLGVIGVSALPVSVGGVLLLVLGVGLFVAEIFIVSYGLLGLAGAISFTAGGLLLVDNIGTDFFADADFGVSPAVFLPTALFVILMTLLIGLSVIRARRRKPATGERGLVGEVGEVEQPIAPEHPGLVFVHGELWRAEADRALPRGMKARVTGIEGLTVHVEPLEG